MSAYKYHWEGTCPTTDESLLAALQTQFKHRQIYSYIGSTLVSINPCRPSGHFYTVDLVQTYQQHNILQLPPHIYGLAEYVHYCMRELNCDQCVIITGESGSGKTETCKYLLQYLMSSRRANEVRTLREQIVTANLLLESFGNAATKLNENASRFGKFIDIEFDFKGDAAGATFTQFLLEKSRVIRQPSCETNFHIFYQLIGGADAQLLKNLKLQRNLHSYELLRHSKHLPNECLCEKQQFALTDACLQTLSLDDHDRQFIWHMLASILKLGNLNFMPKTAIDGAESCALANEFELYEVCELLLVDVFSLQSALTQRTIQTRHETLISDLNSSEAIYTRDALCKALYNRLFTWLVNRINDTIRPKRVGKRQSIGIFDVYGFESNDVNGYEQFLINYCNEKLQQTFIDCTLKQQQELYIKEKISWVSIPYIESQLCFIIENTIFPMLTEESLHLQLTETQLLHQMVDSASDYFNCLPCLKQPWLECTSGLNLTSANQSSESCGSSPATNSTTSAVSFSSLVHHTFAVQHYTSIVTYNVSDFQLRNAEHVLSRDICSALFHSHLNPLPDLFPEANPVRTPVRRPASRCAQLSSGFVRMLDTLCSSRQMHFSHCIRPNRLLPTRQLTQLPNSQSTSILTNHINLAAAVSGQTQSLKSPKITKNHLQQCKFAQTHCSSVIGKTCCNQDQVGSVNIHRPITPMASTSSSGSSAVTKKPIVVTIALDSQYVLDQIRALQLSCYASLQTSGFAFSIDYGHFYRRFSLLIMDHVKHDEPNELFVDLPPMAEELQLIRTARALASKQNSLTSCLLDDSVLDRFCPYSCDARRPKATLTPNRACPWFLHKIQKQSPMLSNAAHDYLLQSVHLLIQLQVPVDKIQLGQSRIFFHHLHTWFRLERLRNLRLDHLVRRIQRMWRLSLARRNFLVIRRSQQVIARSYLTWKKKCFLMHLARNLPYSSPICHDWPAAPTFLHQANYLIRKLYHKWRCAKYRAQFDQNARHMMREKCTASSLLRGRKISYERSVAHPFRGDYVRLRQNVRWKKHMEHSPDAHVVFADIVNKVSAKTTKCVQKLLVLSTTSILILDYRTFQIKYRIPLQDVIQLSLSPFADDFLVIHVNPSESNNRKGAFILETEHVIEVVAKLYLIVRNATGLPIDVQVATEFEANFGKENLLIIFKCNTPIEDGVIPIKIQRKTYRLEFQL